MADIQSNRSEILMEFFVRLEKLGEIVRVIVSNASITVLIAFRGEHEKRVVMDLTKDNLKVINNDKAKDGNIYVTIDAEQMHQVLTEQKTAGTALAERQLLLRGSPYLFSKFIPLFDFGPMLYKEHLADCMVKGYARKSSTTPLKEEKMNTTDTNLQLEKLEDVPNWQKMIFKLFNIFAFILGYVVGLIRYRVLENMSLFEMISSLSKGLQAATPKDYGKSTEELE